MHNVAAPQLVRAGASDMYAPRHGGVAAVAAGGGFSLALTRAGGVYSWGKYANGRLGLGMPPLSRSRGHATAQRYLRYSRTPARVEGGWAAREADVASVAFADRAREAWWTRAVLGYGDPDR